VSAQLTTLIKASWWDRRGRFGIWEGLGCCGLQTTDVMYYGSFPVIQLFPELAKSQMKLTQERVEEPGRIPHNMPGSFACCDLDYRERIDLIPQFILLVWRDTRWSGDLDYLRGMWPTALEALARYRAADTDGDGLPNNSGPDQTYDQFPLQGTSAFCGFLYASALVAMEEMAHWLGDEATAHASLEKRQVVLETLDRQLWNGRWYRLSHDAQSGKNNEGVMADQLSGDWFIRQTTGSGLVPDDRAKAALDAVFKHCRRPEGYLVNCAWPQGGTVEIHRNTADQANWPWSGIEFEIAAHLALLDRRDEALQIARDVWDRYERTGLRFNHIECGGHYCRALSAWALYLSLTGYALNAVSGELILEAPAANGALVFFAPKGWGVVRRDGGRLVIEVKAGELALKRLILRGAFDKEKPKRLGAGHTGLAVEWGAHEIKITGGIRVVPADPLELT
jgi:uncharacterized protein (DUF608 family)